MFPITRRGFLSLALASIPAGLIYTRGLSLRNLYQTSTYLTILENWQAGAGRIHNAGMPLAQHVGNSQTTGGSAASGRTFIMNKMDFRVLQDGYIRQIKVWVNQIGSASGWKFKVFRPVGDVTAFIFDLVSESELITPAGTGELVIDLATPMACQPGDVLGVWIVGGTGTAQAQIKTKSITGGIRWLAGDITGTSQNFSVNVLANNELDMEGLSNPPSFCATGDSIAEGHNEGTWHSFYDTGPKGVMTAEIWHQLRGLAGDGVTLQFQNHALGGQDYTWVVSTGLVSALDRAPYAIFIHCGVNDVIHLRTWDDVAGSLGSVKSLFAASSSKVLLLNEILPWTNGTDEQNGMIRAYNANLASWVSANNDIAGKRIKLVICHDAMGQVRASTGQLDDLLSIYNYDGVHLSSAGVNAMAAIDLNALSNAVSELEGLIPTETPGPSPTATMTTTPGPTSTPIPTVTPTPRYLKEVSLSSGDSVVVERKFSYGEISVALSVGAATVIYLLAKLRDWSAKWFR